MGGGDILGDPIGALPVVFDRILITLAGQLADILRTMDRY
jgi:hypothetical protein